MSGWLFSLGLVPLLLLVAQAEAEDIGIIVVADDYDKTGVHNINSSLHYMADIYSDLLQGHQLKVTFVNSGANETFGAMFEACSLMEERNVSVILDVSSKAGSGPMLSLTSELGITYITVNELSNYQSSYSTNVSVNFRPIYDIMLYVVRDVVIDEMLNPVAIIYDGTFNLTGKPKRILVNTMAQHMYVSMAMVTSEMQMQLDAISQTEVRHIFLLSSSVNAQAYLKQADTLDMLNEKYNWYVITKDSSLSCEFCSPSTSLILMSGIRQGGQLTLFEEYIQLTSTDNKTENINMDSAFFFDLANMTLQSIGSLISSGRWSPPASTSCYMTPQEVPPQNFVHANILRDQIIMTEIDGIFGPFEWTAYQAEQKVSLNIESLTSWNNSNNSVLGNWTHGEGLIIDYDMFERATNTKMYRVVIIADEPPFLFKSETPPNIDEVVSIYQDGFYYYGYCIDLIIKIKQQLQFEIELYEPPDGSYGTMQPDGTWNGMILELIEGRADIALAPLSVMAERENVIDFTVPYYDLVGITILMKMPTFSYSVFKFLTVLDSTVWGCIFSAFIIVSLLLAAFDRFSPYSYQNNKQVWDGQGEEPRIFTLKEGLWFCMTSLTPQGGGEAPRALSGRLVAATWWMFGFIMIATYTANLAAFLTVSRLEQPIESLDDLANQFKTKYAPQNSTSTETYFQRMADIEDKFYGIWKAMSLNDSLDPVERAKFAVWDYPVSDKFTNMWSAMKETGFPNTLAEAIERIKNPAEGEEFAFIGDATQNKYATLTDCDLWEVGEEFSRKPYALAVQQGSPLKTELSSVILQLLNQRYLEDLKAFWWEYDKLDCPKLENESDGISIQNIGGVFLVIFIGIGVGLLTLLAEYYWYKWRPRNILSREQEQQHKENQSNTSNSNHTRSTSLESSQYENNGFTNGVISPRYDNSSTVFRF